MAPQEGILFVKMAPSSELPDARFHDWYNNEHGPVRLRFPFVKNGYRYRATDLDKPSGTGKAEWLATYDISDMNELVKEPYINYRKAPLQSQRERDTMKHIKVDRRFYDLKGSGYGSGPTGHLTPLDFEGRKSPTKSRMVAVTVPIHDIANWQKEYEPKVIEHYLETHKKAVGWRRSRVFITSSIEPRSDNELLILHEFGTDDHDLPSVPDQITDQLPANETRHYELYYNFGPAARHLADASTPQQNPHLTTLQTPEGFNAIESFIHTPDGVRLDFRLEGNPSPTAPLIILHNPILVTYRMWDSVVTSILSHPAGKQYRILRFNNRGRNADAAAPTATSPITIDLLASDVIHLLDALRCPQAAALIGVSLGGITSLVAALNYPTRIAHFVSCDTNAKSPAGNDKQWASRLAVADEESAHDTSTGEPIVGADLAKMTAERWFVASLSSASFQPEIARVSEMLRTASLPGFKKLVEALFEYDYTPAMPSGVPRGLFVVGDQDGVLPEGMRRMSELYQNGKGEFWLVEKAGHTPMVEWPELFAGKVLEFLGEGETRNT